MTLSKLISSMGLLALVGSPMLFPARAPAAAPWAGWIFLVAGIAFALGCFYLAWWLARR